MSNVVPPRSDRGAGSHGRRYRLPIVWLSACLAAFGAAPAASANQPPVAGGDWASTHARQAVLIDLLANDGDADGDPLAVPTVTPPSYGAVENRGDGTVVYTPDPDLFEGSGGDSFSYTVSDGRGGSDTALVSIAEVPVPPEEEPPPDPAVLFEDDFGDGDYLGWDIVDFGGGTSDWRINTNSLEQLSNICCDGRGRGTYAVLAGGDWSDFNFHAKIRSEDDDAIGLVFRYLDGGNHYRFDWRSESKLRRFTKQEDNVTHVLASDNVPYVPGRDYAIDIRVQGSTFQLFIDGVFVFAAQDPVFQSGTIALLSHGNEGSYFDDIQLTEVSTPTSLLLSETFADLDYDGWRIVDLGTREGPSAWSAAAGELRQTSNIHTSIKDGAFGTVAVYEGGRHWLDYHVGLSMRSTDNDSIGVVFRFQDWENFYRFHWSRELGRRDLVKVENGVKTFLLTENVSYAFGKTYLVEILADGPALEVRLDGQTVFTAIDDTHRQGTIGMGSGGNQDSIFDDIVVTALP